jgi:hypothetical protein
VVHKSQHKCEICDKTILKSSFNSHLNSEGHKNNLSYTASNHQQPQQSNTNHIQPQQQRINLGIQSIINADNELAIKYDVILMKKIMKKNNNRRNTIKTINSISPILRRLVAAAKIKCFHDINSDPSNVSKYVLLTIFPKVVLAAMPYELYWKIKLKDRNKKKIEYTNNRIQKWNSGGLTREASVTSSIDSIKTLIKFRINTPEKN